MGPNSLPIWGEIGIDTDGKRRERQTRFIGLQHDSAPARPAVVSLLPMDR